MEALAAGLAMAIMYLFVAIYRSLYYEFKNFIKTKESLNYSVLHFILFCAFSSLLGGIIGAGVSTIAFEFHPKESQYLLISTLASAIAVPLLLNCIYIIKKKRTNSFLYGRKK